MVRTDARSYVVFMYGLLLLSGVGLFRRCLYENKKQSLFLVIGGVSASTFLGFLILDVRGILLHALVKARADA